jgi:hypothetical protein
MSDPNEMTLYRVNYEEYLRFEEFIEAASPEEAQRLFRNSIQDLEPVESEVHDFDAVRADGKGEFDEDVDDKEGNERLRQIADTMPWA